MLFFIENGRLIQDVGQDNNASIGNRVTIEVAGPAGTPAPAFAGYMPERLWRAALNSNAVRFESHEKLDILCISALIAPERRRRDRIHLFLGKDWLYIVCGNSEPVVKLLREIEDEGDNGWTSGRLLYRMLEHFSHQDAVHLDDLEGQIAALEDEVISGRPSGEYVRKIVLLRKHLIRLKREYELMQDVLEELLANGNGLFDSRSLKYFKIFDGKIDRLYAHVAALQEYVTEIRDAYQAQVDISLNTTMKVFTVITAIFLPLTLIAGWYGMNLNMPEYNWGWGYPVIILISVLIVVVEVIYFKRHKWF